MRSLYKKLKAWDRQYVYPLATGQLKEIYESTSNLVGFLCSFKYKCHRQHSPIIFYLIALCSYNCTCLIYTQQSRQLRMMKVIYKKLALKPSNFYLKTKDWRLGSMDDIKKNANFMCCLNFLYVIRVYLPHKTSTLVFQQI